MVARLEEEESRFAEKLTKFKVRNYVETLGFKPETRSERYPTLDLRLKRNRETFEVCRRRFGKKSTAWSRRFIGRHSGELSID